jgi:flagellar FliL protein
MAKDTAKEDLDLGEEKSGKSKLIIIIAVVVLLLVGGGVAAFFLLGGEEEETSEGEAAAEAEVSESTAVEKGPAQYHDMDPAFVINLSGKPSLLQVGINVRVTSDAMVEFLDHNDPMIRHHLLNLLQAVDAKALQERAAKEALQAQLLDEINRIVKELSGPGEVEALFFTSFVMQ